MTDYKWQPPAVDPAGEYAEPANVVDILRQHLSNAAAKIKQLERENAELRATLMEQQQAEIERLRELLRQCESAIDQAPRNAFGVAGDPREGTRYYLADELLAHIRAALTPKEPPNE